MVNKVRECSQGQLDKINTAKVVNLWSRFCESSTHRRFSAFAREGNVRTEVVWGKPFHQPLQYRATSQTAI